MSIPVSVASIHGKERKEIIENVQKQSKEAAWQASKQVLMACLEAQVPAKGGREKGRPRLVSGQRREIDWKCGQCGGQDANQFTRDGHDQRTLETELGPLHQLPVPMSDGSMLSS